MINSVNTFRETTNTNVGLIIVSSSSWGDTNIQPCKWCCILNDIDDSKLVELYLGSNGYLSAELYSGYGMPFYEAWRLGINSGYRSGIPEFKEACGGAGIEIDFRDSQSIVNGLDLLYSNPSRKRLMDDQNLSNAVKNIKEVLKYIDDD